MTAFGLPLIFFFFFLLQPFNNVEWKCDGCGGFFLIWPDEPELKTRPDEVAMPCISCLVMVVSLLIESVVSTDQQI